MRKLPLPTRKAVDVFSTCIKQVRDQDLQNRLNEIVSQINAGETKFVDLAKQAILHEFPRQSSIEGVQGDELVGVYSGRFVPKNCTGRQFYEELISSAPHDRCPLCGIGQVMTLDHHLPKSYYPILAVTPVNLLPACTWCQRSKRQEYPTKAEEQSLHPYFDDFECDRWLHAGVLKTKPASFRFNAQGNDSITSEDLKRLEYHLKAFNLNTLFASNAAHELVSIRHSLQILFDAGGMNSVQDHLSREALSRELANKNSWQTAMYHAAAESVWFCEGGFLTE